MSREVIGYGPTPAGLNNQTIALLGLVCFAKNHNFRIAIPRFVNFSTAHLKPHEAMLSNVAMREVFDVDRLKDFLVEQEIEASEDQFFTNKIKMGQMFWLGMDINRASCFERNGLAARFWSALRPTIKLLNFIEKVEAEAFDGQGIDAILQVRLEPDMKRFFSVKFGDASRPVTYAELMGSMSNAFGGKVKNILLACDETHFRADEMTAIANRYGFRVAVKSDVLKDEIDQNDFLSRSIVDFYLAARTKLFIGAVYSTFAQIAFSMRYALAQDDDWAHYTYRYEHREADTLAKRRKSDLPKPVTLPNVSSMSFNEKSSIKLTTHVGMLGDLVSNFGWSLQRADKHEIQGFELAVEDNDYKVYYRARLDNDLWTDWVSNGFVGTRGKGRPLKGYSLKILNKEDVTVKFRAAAKFTSGYFCYIEECGDLLAQMPEDLLCGMQICILP